MKIESLQISNILSFRHVEDISLAEKITFDDSLNIIIGENGAGKSTALEVINFLFRRVIFKQYNFNHDLYEQRVNINADQRRQVVSAVNHNSYSGFRLDPNWNTEDSPQKIRIVLNLDHIDSSNISLISEQAEKYNSHIQRYSTRSLYGGREFTDTYTLDVTLNRGNQNFNVQPYGCNPDLGYEYLTEYHFYKEIISLYNLESKNGQIDTLFESFTLISSYRNYHAFNTSISLRDQHPTTQIRNILSTDFNRSLNSNDNSEPSIFGLVRLRVAEKHFGLMPEKLSAEEREIAANDLQFIKDINSRLRVVNLKCKIKLIDQRSWQYSFEFIDLRRGKAISDINSLSAGQKAITHLVFEAYGRGDLKGGVVIIDEPEIHLHYQFQHEYLQVIRELNRHQKCQYILVTHSEALINSTTISSVRRFSLNAQGDTEIRTPILTEAQKLLIRILDNTRSTYAFFSKKVVLVEGDSDRFFFKSVLHMLHPELDQEIAVLHVGGKNELLQWTALFDKFGLKTYRIADLDYSYNIFYSGEPKLSLKSESSVAEFKSTHADVDIRIQAEYANRTFVLSHGDLEKYLGVNKDLSKVIDFCESGLKKFLDDATDRKSVEINLIISNIVS